MTSAEQPASPRIGPSQDVIRQLANSLTGKDTDPTNLRRRWASITAVNADLTVDISLDGITIPSVKRSATYIPVIGDTVRLDVNGTDIVVAGATVTSANDLSNIPPTLVAHQSSIAANANIITAHTVQLATHTTQITSTTQSVTGLQDKVNGSTVKFQGQSVSAASTVLTGNAKSDTLTVGTGSTPRWSHGPDGSSNAAILSPQGGAGIVAVGSNLFVVNSNNTLNHAPLTASVVNSDGDFHGAGFYGNGVNVGQGRVDCGLVNNGAMTCSGDITVVHHGQFGSLDSYSGIGTPANVQCNTINGMAPASLRKWKTDIAEESALEKMRGAKLYWWRYTEEAERVMADEKYPVNSDDWHLGPMVDDMPDGAITPTEHGGTPEYFGMIKYSWGATVELIDKVDALEKENAELKSRLDRIEAMLGPVA